MSLLPFILNADNGGETADKRLIFHAPLQTSFDADGGSLYQTSSWQFVTFRDVNCVSKASSNKGIFYNMDQPILGNVPFTFSIKFYTSMGGSYIENIALFYIGSSNVDQSFGFEFVTNDYTISTAWGDNISYTPTLNWENYNDKWSLFTATYDGSIIKVYFDGVLAGTSDPVTLNITESTGNFSGVYGDLAIGSRWIDRRVWLSYLADMRIYNYALSDAEVLDLYNQTM